MTDVDGTTIHGERIISADACVIGTGAGGAPVAAELARGGMRVVVLERGTDEETESFTARPREMTARLYADAGATTTVGAPPIMMPLGHHVGGTTLINSGTCFRTPAHVLEHWRTELGIDTDGLDDCFARVEETIGVRRVSADIAGRNALLVKQGAEALGLHGDFLLRNARGCVGSGVCAFGCPVGAKQHMGLTYVPLARAAGADVFTNVRARAIEIEGDRVREIVARTAGGGTLRVRADHVVVAAGTIGTPLLLGANRIGTASGRLGRNLSIHPASAVRALFDEDVDPWVGVPQSYYIDALADEGIMFEGISGPPDALAISTPGAGAQHAELMANAHRMGSFGVMVCDTARGRVRSVLGRPLIRYDLHQDDVARFHRGYKLLADVFFAAGARAVAIPLDVPILRDGDTRPLAALRPRARDIKAMAFHPLGTAAAGADPRRSVLEPDLRVRGLANLYVADGSAVPTPLGVNPQLTIMALATRLAFGLLGEPVPRTSARQALATP